MIFFYLCVLLSITPIATHTSDEYIYIKKAVSPDVGHALDHANGYTVSQHHANNIDCIIHDIKKLWQDPEIIHNCGNLFIGDSDNIFITIRDNTTSATLGCIQIGSDKNTTLGVYQLAVEKNHRKKGFAQLLMHMAENYAATIKCSQILLLVRKDNEKALSFYSKYGFLKETENNNQDKVLSEK